MVSSCFFLPESNWTYFFPPKNQLSMKLCSFFSCWYGSAVFFITCFRIRYRSWYHYHLFFLVSLWFWTSNNCVPLANMWGHHFSLNYSFTSVFLQLDFFFCPFNLFLLDNNFFFMFSLLPYHTSTCKKSHLTICFDFKLTLCFLFLHLVQTSRPTDEYILESFQSSNKTKK